MTISKRHLVIALALLVLGGAGWSGWHLYQDHRDHHRMVGMWNVYGPMIQAEYAKYQERQTGSSGMKPAEKSTAPPQTEKP